MASALDKIRAKLEEEKAKQGADRPGFFSMRDVPVGGQTRIRFIDDTDDENDMFWRSFFSIRLNFPISDGGTRYVPLTSMKTWGERCVFDDKSAEYFKAGDKETGLSIWPRRSHVFQCFVDGGAEVKGINISNSLFGKISTELLDPEFGDTSPVDPDAGYDYIIRKHKKGEYPNYDASSFSRGPSALTAEQREAAGLAPPLRTLMPQRPNGTQLALYPEILETFLAGGDWNETWTESFPFLSGGNAD